MSQPVVNGRAAGNILLSSHLLFSGVKVAPTLRMLQQMNVQVLSEKRVYEYEGALLLPAVDKVSTILTELRRMFRINKSNFFKMP